MPGKSYAIHRLPGVHLLSQPSFVAANIEQYDLPHSIIVNVKQNSLSSVGERKLILRLGYDIVEIPYKVVNGYTVIPEIGELMDAKTIDQCVEIITRFAERCNGLSSDSVYSERYIQMCSLLSAPGIFNDTGADMTHVKEVNVAMQRQCESIYDRGVSTGREQGREEGLQYALRSLMRNMGMSEEQARKVLGLGDSGAKKKNGALQKMNL